MKQKSSVPKSAPPPEINPESWRALLAMAADLSAFAPWEFCFDSEVAGLIDSATGEKRIASVLGNAGEVFAVVIYRRSGLGWILSMISEPDRFSSLNFVDGMDCLKVEFVPKRELVKEDLAVVKAAAFKPAGKGSVWPQFRSAEPGWHPWHINQSEAEQLKADLPRLAAFYRMLELNPDLYEGRAVTEVPFVPVALPDRPLSPDAIDWQPLLPPPEMEAAPFQIDDERLKKLQKMKHVPDCTCEFDCVILPGASFIESGRPCFGRCSMLADARTGMILGVSMQSAVLPQGQAAGNGLVESLLAAGFLPGKIAIDGAHFQKVLQPLCNVLQIQLRAAASLPAIEPAMTSISMHLGGGGR